MGDFLKEWVRFLPPMILGWLVTFIVMCVVVAVVENRGKATEFSECQQRQQMVKAQQKQAEALEDIAAALKDLKKACK